VSSESTVDELLDDQGDLPRELQRLRVARWCRRATLAVFGAIVLAGVVGLLGERRGEATASAAGSRVSVGYPSIVRNGPPTNLDIEVRRDAGFDTPVVVSFDASYLAALEQVEISPAPDSEESAGDGVRIRGALRPLGSRRRASERSEGRGGRLHELGLAMRRVQWSS
jgi:hypothetical protein